MTLNRELGICWTWGSLSAWDAGEAYGCYCPDSSTGTSVRQGVYTRRRGLDRETNKELLLRHIQDNRKQGSQLRELVQVLPALSYVQVQKLLQELRIKGQIHKVGNTSAARWYPGGPLAGIMPK